MITSRRVRPLCVLALVGASALALAQNDAPTGYREEIEQYRRDREERLRAPEGWLSLVGLHWLDEGDNRFGSDETLGIVLPEGAAPAVAGNLQHDGRGEVKLVAAPEVEITIEGEPVHEKVLHDDGGGAPDVFRLGRLSLHLIRRGDRVALRVKDPESAVRTEFSGLDYFPVDSGYRVKAKLEPYYTPREVEVPTVAGVSTKMFVPGKLVFRLGEASLGLEPLVGQPDDTTLFIIFRDETTGTETYGAGRYLYADLVDGHANVDFNRAYNPPCAFTPYATCPLPPRANRLPVPVRAGEKRYGDH